MEKCQRHQWKSGLLAMPTHVCKNNSNAASVVAHERSHSAAKDLRIAILPKYDILKMSHVLP